ncbi:MAG: hypothetical protein HFH85_09265 [Lachnospiraceae bacterium]|jgi:flagellar protein FlgJ|nr:hypothetical protein [Lachnospiraceae bacterium]
MTDFSDVTAMYGNMYTNAANQTASRLQNQLDGKDYSKVNEDELMNACKQFEAYFIEQMYKSMLKTIPQSEDTSNYTSTVMDFYKDQMVQSIAEETGNQGGFGLAQMLYEQMKRNYGIPEVPEGAQTAAAANTMEQQGD